MKILGIAGAKGVGKDTLAGFVAKQAQASSFRVHHIAFADALKRMLLPLGFADDVLWGASDRREWVQPALGISARGLLQKIGTEVARQIDADFWVKAWSATVDQILTGRYSYAPDRGLLGPFSTELTDDVLIVVADLRFANEQKELARRNAYTVLVERDGLKKVDQHVSEHWCREGARQCVQEIVPNNGPKEELEQRACEIFRVLVGG
jgi:hypothetical protein